MFRSVIVGMLVLLVGCSSGGNETPQPEPEPEPEPALYSLPFIIQPSWFDLETGLDIVVMEIGANEGVIVNDNMDDSAALIAVIDALDSSKVYQLNLPAGTLDFDLKMDIKKAVILNGQGKDQTIFNLRSEKTPFKFSKYKRGNWFDPTADFNVFSDRISMPTNFIETIEVGHYIEIEHDVNAIEPASTDPVDTTSSENYMYYAQGQVNQIAAIEGNDIVLTMPVSADYSHKKSRIRELKLLQTAGLTNLHLNRNFEENRNHSGNSVWMHNVANVKIENIRSSYSVESHVNLQTVYKGLVANNDFADAFRLDTGGFGYGVELSRHTTGVIVDSNSFTGLRHSVMVHLGANLNLFKLNASVNEKNHEGNISSGLSIHGHYPSLNIFENNVFQLGYADAQGINLPMHIIFRNCFTKGFRLYESDGQFLLNNLFLEDETGENIIDMETAEFDYQTLVIEGNHINGEIQWNTGPFSFPDTLSGTSTDEELLIGNDKPNHCTNPALERLK
jgi:hypothetical protein